MGITIRDCLDAKPIIDRIRIQDTNYVGFLKLYKFIGQFDKIVADYSAHEKGVRAHYKDAVEKTSLQQDLDNYTAKEVSLCHLLTEETLKNLVFTFNDWMIIIQFVK